MDPKKSTDESLMEEVDLMEVDLTVEEHMDITMDEVYNPQQPTNIADKALDSTFDTKQKVTSQESERIVHSVKITNTTDKILNNTFETNLNETIQDSTAPLEITVDSAKPAHITDKILDSTFESNQDETRKDVVASVDFAESTNVADKVVKSPVKLSSFVNQQDEITQETLVEACSTMIFNKILDSTYATEQVELNEEGPVDVYSDKTVNIADSTFVTQEDKASLEPTPSVEKAVDDLINSAIKIIENDESTKIMKVASDINLLTISSEIMEETLDNTVDCSIIESPEDFVEKSPENVGTNVNKTVSNITPEKLIEENDKWVQSVLFSPSGDYHHDTINKVSTWRPSQIYSDDSLEQLPPKLTDGPDTTVKQLFLTPNYSDDSLEKLQSEVSDLEKRAFQSATMKPEAVSSESTEGSVVVDSGFTISESTLNEPDLAVTAEPESQKNNTPEIILGMPDDNEQIIEENLKNTTPQVIESANMETEIIDKEVHNTCKFINTTAKKSVANVDYDFSIFSDSPAKRSQKRGTIFRLFDPLYDSPIPVETKTADRKAEITEKKVESVDTILETELISIPKDKMEEEKIQMEEELNQVKLEFNQLQQDRAALELELHQKDEVILKIQGEAQKKEGQFKIEIKQLLDKLSTVSVQNNNEEVKLLQEEIAALKEQEVQLNEKLNKFVDKEGGFKNIVQDYESTLTRMVQESEKLKVEHDTAKKHLATLEMAFSDVHTKYERCKDIITGYKNNEDTLTESLHESNQTARKYEERYESLKAHAKTQLDKANKDMACLKEKHHTEMNKLTTIIRCLEIKNGGIQQSLDQKNKECADLAALCAEMTGSVPH